MKPTAWTTKRGGVHPRAEKRARTALLTGPIAQATAAQSRGDGFFELWVRVTDTTTSSSMLADIEAIGWKLEHAGYAFDSGVPVAVYLFRRERRAINQLRSGHRAATTPPSVTVAGGGSPAPIGAQSRAAT